MWLESSQPPGSGDVAITCMPPGAWLSPSRFVGLITTVSVTTGARCGRTRVGTTNCRTAKAASVIAIAGNGRRTSMPTATPSTNANSA